MVLTSQPIDACVVFVTCGNREEANIIAEAVVTEKLAACANLLGAESPLKSFYFWEGSLQKDSEVLLVIKTRMPLLTQLEKRIGELHSYTVPEFIALPIVAGSESYLDWIRDNVK